MQILRVNQVMWPYLSPFIRVGHNSHNWRKVIMEPDLFSIAIPFTPIWVTSVCQRLYHVASITFTTGTYYNIITDMQWGRRFG